MKLTKGMIRDLIKEEIEASLEEAPKVPKQVDRGLDMVMGDGGDEKVLAKIKDMNGNKIIAKKNQPHLASRPWFLLYWVKFFVNDIKNITVEQKQM